MKNINKNGFTLIELLAVIIILSVLMLIAVPGTLKLMDNSRINAFATQAQMIYKTATEQFLIDTANNVSRDGVTYCKDVLGTTDGVKKLELTGNDKVYYKIVMDNQGKVLSYHITNTMYSIKNTDDKKDINSINKDNVKTGSDYVEVSCAS